MTYLAKFDANGKRLSSYANDSTLTKERYAELIADGYVEISEEDWSYYVGNKGNGANGTGYIRGEDGKPTDAPPATEPTTDEKIAALDAQYQHDKDSLMQAYLNAMLYGDTEQMETLKADLDALDAKYDEDYEAIIDEEG
jgi:hypothetical protein